MKEIEIQEALLKNNINYKHYASICTTIVSSLGAYNNGFGTIMHMMKDHILHFNDEGIAFFAIDDIAGVLKEESLIFLKNEDILSKSIQVKLLNFTLTIKTTKGDINYKIRKSVLGARWHKENLSFLLLNVLSA